MTVIKRTCAKHIVAYHAKVRPDVLNAPDIEWWKREKGAGGPCLASLDRSIMGAYQLWLWVIPSDRCRGKVCHLQFCVRVLSVSVQRAVATCQGRRIRSAGGGGRGGRGASHHHTAPTARVVCLPPSPSAHTPNSVCVRGQHPPCPPTNQPPYPPPAGYC